MRCEPITRTRPQLLRNVTGQDRRPTGPKSKALHCGCRLLNWKVITITTRMRQRYVSNRRVSTIVDSRLRFARARVCVCVCGCVCVCVCVCATGEPLANRRVKYVTGVRPTASLLHRLSYELEDGHEAEVARGGDRWFVVRRH